MKIAQFLLTRFNPTLRYASKDIGIDPAWLSHRFDLFEKICLPSVASQIERDFHWVLLVSDRTPRQFIVRLLDDLTSVSSPVLMLLVTKYSEEAFITAIVNCLEHAVDRVVTTRLDNDDAIARDYLADVRLETSRLPVDRDFVINFRQGCQVAKNSIFPRNASLNPFLSLVSSPSNLKTAFAAPHARMNCVGSVIDKAGANAKWIQVIHGQNLQNRLRAHESCSEDYLHNFTLAKGWQSCL
jgi:hypothetical protein